MFHVKKLIAPFANAPSREFPGVPSTFSYEYLPHASSRELAVVLSPSSQLTRYISGATRHVLYLSDPHHSFYVDGLEETAAAVVRHIAAHELSKTVFVGGSKAGFGALMLTALCARESSGHPFRCLALSPHTKIYPENPGLRHYMVYRALLKRAKADPDFRERLSSYGDAKICEGLDNTFIMIVYGEANRVDREEADRLLSFNIRKYPLPFGFHNTKAAMLIKEQPARLRRRAVEKIFATMQRTEEGRSSIPATADLLAEQIEQTVWLPGISEALAEVMRV